MTRFDDLWRDGVEKTPKPIACGRSGCDRPATWGFHMGPHEYLYACDGHIEELTEMDPEWINDSNPHRV